MPQKSTQCKCKQVAFFALLSSALINPLVAAGQQDAKQHDGTISGHAFTAAAHPLQGTTITLLNDSRTIHQVAHCDAAGAYVFSSLPNGQYSLFAFHVGYFAEYSNMAPDTVMLRAGHTVATADFKLTPSPQIETMRDEALSASYSVKERSQLTFSSGTFSPDMRYLALETTGVVTGEPEQAWRYEFATAELVPVTPTPTEAKSPQIFTLRWAGDAIKVMGIDLYGSREFESELPEHGSASINYSQATAPWPQADDPLTSAGRYKLTPIRLYGGSTTWSAQLDGRGPGKLAATALLQAPVVNANVPFFFYVPVGIPGTYGDQTVAVLDLHTGRHVTQRLPQTFGLQLVAVAPDADGFLLAYQVSGGCEPTPNNDGEDSDQLDTDTFGRMPSGRRVAHLCFVHLSKPRE